jgi:ABC-type nitrate/sulfonate/bicarbonate transport system ATPase subunit
VPSEGDIRVDGGWVEAAFLADRVLVMSERPGGNRGGLRRAFQRPRSLDVMADAMLGVHPRVHARP